MLKMLKFDFYKIIKSKILLTIFIVTLCSVLIGTIYQYVVDSSSISTYSAYNVINYSGFNLDVFLWIFVIPFASKDFSSGYIKNLCANLKKSDKVYYILSKVIYIAAFCIIYAILAVVLGIMFNYIFGGKCIYNPIEDEFTKRDLYLKIFSNVLNGVAMGTVYLFLCTLLKKEFIVLIIVLPYIFFLSSLLYSAINSIVGNGFNINKYMIFGMYNNITNCEGKAFILPILLSLGYIALFTVLSWLAFRKKNY